MRLLPAPSRRSRCSRRMPYTLSPDASIDRGGQSWDRGERRVAGARWPSSPGRRLASAPGQRPRFLRPGRRPRRWPTRESWLARTVAEVRQPARQVASITPTSPTPSACAAVVTETVRPSAGCGRAAEQRRRGDHGGRRGTVETITPEHWDLAQDGQRARHVPGQPGSGAAHAEPAGGGVDRQYLVRLGLPRIGRAADPRLRGPRAPCSGHASRWRRPIDAIGSASTRFTLGRSAHG